MYILEFPAFQLKKNTYLYIVHSDNLHKWYLPEEWKET